VSTKSIIRFGKWLVLTIGTGIALRQLLVALLVNWGMLSLQTTLMAAQDEQMHYPHWNEQVDADSLDRASRVIQVALSIEPTDRAALWASGRIALLTGDAVAATEALPVDGSTSRREVLRYLDTMTAHSWANSSHWVLQLYEQASGDWMYSSGSFPEQLVAELVSIAHLNLAQHNLDTGSEAQARAHVQNVLQVREGDLYANYYNWLLSTSQKNDFGSPSRERLIFFTKEGVDFGDERLLNYSLQVLPRLNQNGIWDTARSQNIIAYWVWKHYESSALSRFLEEQQQAESGNPIWAYYLAELYSRREELEEAQRYCELGKQAELNFADTPYAAPCWPSEVSSLVYRGSHPSPSDEDLVADILGVDITSIRLSDNLIGEFVCATEQRSLEPRWTFQIDGGEKEWQFDAGIDSFERRGSIRIVNLWWPETEDPANQQPYAYCHGPALTNSSRWLLMSAWYKTAGGTPNSGRLFLGNPRGTVADRFVQVLLPETEGRWARVIIVGKVPQGLTSLEPLLVNTGAASTWYDDISIKTLRISEAPSACLDEPCISYFAAGH
jgi:hypothetical protein